MLGLLVGLAGFLVSNNWPPELLARVKPILPDWAANVADDTLIPAGKVHDSPISGLLLQNWIKIDPTGVVVLV